MSKRDAIQNAINISSLMMTTNEDVAKACLKAEMHPEITKVLLNFHHALKDQDNALKEMREANLTMAKVLSNSVDHSVATMKILDAVVNKLGIDKSSLFSPEEI